MTRKKLLLLSLIVFCLSVFSSAQADPIAPDRRIDWSPAGISGGIPNRTTICATLNPGATAAQINSAIASCPNGQVVLLSAGTYSLTAGIDFNNKRSVTLRGAGPDQTFLVFSAGAACGGLGGNVCFRNGALNSVDFTANAANWTGGYTKGATSITLSSTANLQVGSLLILDQLNDSNADNGDIWVCKTAGVCAIEGSSLGRPSRNQIQVVKVTAINGSTVTITPGLYMPNWRGSQSPGAWWSSDTPISMSGIEDLSLVHTGSSATTGIYFFNANNCWIKNVKSLNARRNHIWLYQSANNVVRDSYIYGTQSAASQSYGVETFAASANLLENNIFHHVTAPMMMGSGGTGNVYGYNFAIDDFYYVAGWMQASLYHHNTGISYNLFEGHDGIGFAADQIHGTSHFATVFRSRLAGWEPGKTLQTIPIHIYTFNRYFNVVGSLLGTVGYHNTYQSAPPFGTNGNTAIYTLGWGGNGGQNGTLPNDPLVAATLMRWGNCDVVTGTCRFASSEVPSGLAKYANAVPPDQTLPNSYYLSAKPSWFGSIPWPSIGPEVTGGQEFGGHLHKIPARLCYENSPKDINGIVNFNANTCYGNTLGPPAPTNLTIQ